jgi:hypothetical protein
MNIEDVSVIHFSGDITPRDYYHSGFEQFWTDESPIDWIHFAAKLTKRYAGEVHVKMPEEDRQRIEQSIHKWKEVHDMAWDAIIQGAVGDENEITKCPLCGGDPDREHAFFMCQKVQAIKTRWMNSRLRDKTNRLWDVMAFYPKLFPDSLCFVAEVALKRHPHERPKVQPDGKAMPMKRHTGPQQRRNEAATASDAAWEGNHKNQRRGNQRRVRGGGRDRGRSRSRSRHGKARGKGGKKEDGESKMKLKAELQSLKQQLQQAERSKRESWDYEESVEEPPEETRERSAPEPGQYLSLLGDPPQALQHPDRQTPRGSVGRASWGPTPPHLPPPSYQPRYAGRNARNAPYERPFRR